MTVSGKVRDEEQGTGVGEGNRTAGWRLLCTLASDAVRWPQFSLPIVMASGQRGAAEPDL